jgi:hypothetical protein
MRLACVTGAAWLLALGACRSFDKSLIDYASPAPHPSPELNDAGQPVRPPQDPRVSHPQVDANMARDASVGGPGFDAGPPPPTPEVDDGGDDDGGSRVCTPTLVADFCTRLPALANAPVIDGVLDCGLTLQAIDPKGWDGMSPIPAGQATKLAAAVRSNGVYLYIEVHGHAAAPHPAGSAIYCGDAVELYVDASGTYDSAGKYSQPGTIQFIIAAPSSSGTTVEAMRYIDGTDHGAWTTSEMKTRVLGDGFAIEAFVRAADLDLNAWSPKKKLGFDVGVDVSAPAGTTNLRCGQQIGQYFMHVTDQTDTCSGQPYCDTRAFCTPAL